jgi:uncharacterized repeat protein (TIGR01451 family)
MQYDNLKSILLYLVFLSISLFAVIADAIEVEPEEPNSSQAVFCSTPLYTNDTSFESNSEGAFLIGHTSKRWERGSTVTYSIDMTYVAAADFTSPIQCTVVDSKGKCTKKSGICKAADSSADCRVKLQNYIKPIAEEWNIYGNITLQYTSTWNDADIRIRFAEDHDVNGNKLASDKVQKATYHSLVGIDAQKRDNDRSTMVLGVDGWKSDWINTAIRHEFGHALGLKHEHLRSDRSYTIDKAKAYAYYEKKPNEWNKKTVDSNVLTAINVTTAAYAVLSPYDPDSIMHYSVRSEIVKDINDCPEKVEPLKDSAGKSIKNKDGTIKLTKCVTENSNFSQLDKDNFKLFYSKDTVYNANSPVTGISIASSSNSTNAKANACLNEYYKELIDIDLNAGAGGNYIYMCLARIPDGWPIIDITTANTLDGCPVGFDIHKTDLNHTVKGEYIYLCTKSLKNLFEIYQPIYAINIGRAPYFNAFKTRDLAKSRCLGKDNNEFPNLIDQDLNAGAGGDYVFLCTNTTPSAAEFSLTTNPPQDKLVEICNTGSSVESITVAKMYHAQGYNTDWLSEDLGSIAPATCQTFNFGKNYTSMVYFYAYTSTGREWPVIKKHSDRKFCVKPGSSWSFSADRNDQCETDGGFLMRGAGYYLQEGINTIEINPEYNIRTLAITKRNGDATAGGTVKTSLSSAIDCGADCSASFKGSFVQDKILLNAAPNSISNFAGWRGCTPVAGKPLTCKVATTEDKNVEAFFTKKPVLIVDKRGQGRGRLISTHAGLDCGLDCIYEKGGVVTVKAEPNIYSRFVSWGGIGSKNCSNDSSFCQVAVDDFQYLVAKFDLLPSDFTLTVSKTGKGNVLSASDDIDCGIQCQKAYPRKATFAEAVRVSLVPVVETDSVFLGWNGACSGKGECRLIMDKDQIVTATFAVTDPKVFVTTTLEDSGEGSLRQAIVDANNNPGSDVITLAENLSGMVILTNGPLKITDAFILEGPGASELIISGNNTSRVFEISAGAIDTVSISGITIRDGHVADGDGGGGIYISSGDVIVKNSVLSDNTVVGGAGGGSAIRKLADAGSLTIVNSTFFNNSAIDDIDEFGSADGGAIRNDVNQLTIINSTFSANKARFGGAIYNPNGTATIQNSTIAGNTAIESGGGIYNNDKLVISNTIISGNIAPTGVPELDSFILISQGNNLFGENSNAGVSPSITLSNNDLIHLETIDTVIGALKDNGGETPTRLPIKGSPVINTGNNSLIPAGITTDQRGINAPRIVGGTVDIGATEYFSIAQKAWDFDRSSRYTVAANVKIIDGLATGIINDGLKVPDLRPPSVNPQRGFRYSKPLKLFEETLSPENQGSIRYQLVTNGIAYYHNGTVWDAASLPSESNTPSEINEGIQNFHTLAGFGQLTFNAFFTGIEGQKISLDTLTVTAQTETEALSIRQKVSKDSVSIDEEFAYMITVDNSGFSVAENIGVEDILPSDVVFISATGTDWDCTEETHIVNCELPKLSVGSSSDIAIKVKAAHNARFVDNQVTVFSSVEETNLDNNISIETTIIQAPDSDGDGFQDNEDNCPTLSNINQLDVDADGLGNVCDPIDNNLLDPDNDGLTNAQELTLGTNPNDPDSDQDGLSDSDDSAPLTSFTLSIYKIGPGSGVVTSHIPGIDCGTDCTENFPSDGGSLAKLSAIADSGSVFLGWSGACAGINICTVTMTNYQAVTAKFGEGESYQVSNLNDNGIGSLRQTILDANADSKESFISFIPELDGTITLTSGQLTITDSLVLDGPGADVLAISGNNRTRILIIDPSETGIVTIYGLTFKEGNDNTGEGGGAIKIDNGNITLIHSALIANSANVDTGGGGGIRKFGPGSLTIRNSVIVDNSAINEFDEGEGGGIRIDQGIVTIINSTISGNSSANGGGIAIDDGTLSIASSTVTNNSAVWGGGGIFNGFGTVLTLSNNIVVGNRAPEDKEIQNFGSFLSLGHNLLGENAVVGVTTESTLVSSDYIFTGPVASVIEPLKDNGGSTLTHLPIKGGPAIDAGNNQLIPQGTMTDQRGLNFIRVINGTIDIGSVEILPSPAYYP